MTIPAKTQSQTPAKTLEDVLISGDLSKLTPEQRTEYYLKVCQSLGLNPMTRPFDYIVLNGKLQLYAKRDAADQLRKLHGISIEIISQDLNEGLFSVHVRAKDKDGRADEDLGVVSMSNTKGDIAANLILKAVTKAKRRVTLSICGLGFLDETEVDDIPQSAKHNPPAEQEVIEPFAFTVPILSDGSEAPDWIDFGAKLLGYVKQARNREEADEWIRLNHDSMKQCAVDNPKVSQRLSAALRDAGNDLP